MVTTLIQLPQIVGYYLILNLDIISFFLIGYLFTRNIFRSLIIWAGFLVAQISLQNPQNMQYVEWALEIIGLTLILIGMWGLKDEKEQLKENTEQIQRWKKKQKSLRDAQTVIYDGQSRKKRSEGRKTT